TISATFRVWRPSSSCRLDSSPSASILRSGRTKRRPKRSIKASIGPSLPPVEGSSMLGKKSRSQAPIGTLVGADTRVHGDIEFSGGFHVDGYVKGNVRATKDARAVLSISERGCVEGAVVVPHVVLNG